MKKLLSVAVALLMVLAIVPMSAFAKAITPTVDPEWPTITLTLPTVTVDTPAVGTRTDWMICTINEASQMTGAAFLIEFDYNYLTVQSCQYTGTWSVANALKKVTDGSTDWIADGCPITLETQGGNSTLPIVISDGVDGVWYTVIQLATQPATGFTTAGGIMLGGSLFRLRYEFKAIPEYNCTLPIVLNAPILGCVTDHTYYPEENITITDGAINVTGLGDAPVVTDPPIVTDPPVIVTDPPVVGGDNPVVWTGDVVNQETAEEGDQFNWYISINENTGLHSAEVFVDYDQNYLEFVDADTNNYGEDDEDMDLLGTWIDFYMEDEGDYPEGSAIPIFLNVPEYICTENYANLIPEMVAGEPYNRLGVAMQKFMEDYNGLQWGGKLARYIYEWKTIPAANDPGVMQDENGYYLPMKIYNTYTRIYQEQPAPYYHDIDEELLTIVDGKIYFTPAEVIVEPTYYTVTFVDGLTNEVIATQQVEEGTAATAPAAPVHEGYNFVGWDVDFSNVTGNLTVTAQYEAIPVNYYTVTFVDGLTNEVIATVEVEEGTAATAPAAPVHEGYNFTGWDTDFSNVTGNLTVTAQYAPKTYRIWVYYLNAETNGALVSGDYYDLTYGTVTNFYPKDIEGWVCTNPEAGLNYTVTGNDEIEFLYIPEEVPYEPVPPTVAGETAELREREETDTTADIRFIFKVTFNDSFINYEGTVYGPTQEYFEITKFYAVLQAGGNPLTVDGKNIWTMADDSFTYTATLIKIPAARFATNITATPYIIYDGITATGAALEASVDSLLN